MGYVYLLLIIILIGLIRYLKSTRYKGLSFERKINQHLVKLAETVGGLEISDLMIPYNGGTSQIDNILITSKAIYVIEAKNYNGFIYGSLDHQNWTLTTKTVKTYKNRRGNKYQKSYINKYPFYNPIKQNTTHVNAVKTLCKIAQHPIVNIVVFGRQAELKEIQTNPSHPVLKFPELKSFIELYEQSHPPTFSMNDMMDVVDTLYFHTIKDRKARKRHIKNIRTTHAK